MKQQEEVASGLPTILEEEIENSLETPRGRWFRTVLGIMGGRGNLPGKGETDTDEKALGEVDLGGAMAS